ncbi:hypothetical protein B566_EDAN016268, partial [Ephemera danica]
MRWFMVNNFVFLVSSLLPLRFQTAQNLRRLHRSYQRTHCLNKAHTAAAHHNTGKTFVFKDIATSSHVFLRTDLSRASLEPPYTGPYRNDKTFKILVKNKIVVVSIDRLKPAYILDDAEYKRYHVPTTSKKSTGAPKALLL